MQDLCTHWFRRWLKVENIVAKGEIARFVQFLLLPQCFPLKPMLSDASAADSFLKT